MFLSQINCTDISFLYIQWGERIFFIKKQIMLLFHIHWEFPLKKPVIFLSYLHFGYIYLLLTLWGQSIFLQIIQSFSFCLLHCGNISHLHCLCFYQLHYEGWVHIPFKHIHSPLSFEYSVRTFLSHLHCWDKRCFIRQSYDVS